MTDSLMERHLDRGTLVKRVGALVVVLGAPRLLDPRVAQAAVADEFPIGPAAIDAGLIDSWIAVHANGMVTVKTGKVELGQGTGTVALQLVADELDVPLDKIKLVQSDTWHTPDQGNTAGSQSAPTQFGPDGLRAAAAEARLALLGMAAQRLNVPIAGLRVSDGVVSSTTNPSVKVSYAELIGGRLFTIRRTGLAQPKSYHEYKVVGTSVPRRDLPDIVFGRFTYTSDIRLPGLAYGQGANFVPAELKEKWPEAPRKLIARPLDVMRSMQQVKANVPVVEASLISGPKGSAVVLANYTYQPVDKLTLDVHRDFSTATSIEGVPVKLEKTDHGVHLELPLKWTDIVILK